MDLDTPPPSPSSRLISVDELAGAASDVEVGESEDDNEEEDMSTLSELWTRSGSRCCMFASLPRSVFFDHRRSRREAGGSRSTLGTRGKSES